jgi:cytochrome P450
VTCRLLGIPADEQELTATAWLLITSGYATTANTIGNAVLALLTDPGRLAALTSAPQLIDRAVDELLRRDGGVNLAPVRVATEPVEIGDVTIEGGELVHIAVASANRDPAHFDDAERLDFERRQGDHLAFGHGMRYCLGAELARMETRIALARLLGRFPNLSLASDAASLRWQDTPVLRGVETLPVRLH